MLGGGAVLLAPGCFNYALVLPLEVAPELVTVDGTNAYVLERHRAAFAKVVGEGVRVQCCTDLALGDRKFSGNAQRRRRRAVLFHGTILLSMDLDLVKACLPMPSRQPRYRRGRAHRDFLVNLGIGTGEARAALAEAWGAREPAETKLLDRIASIHGLRLPSERTRLREGVVGWDERKG
ncbi:MAG: hypothetical protein HYY13_02475 [Nitrospirae bacterium]|nr:hypothetical protein [Nitrospirota bacterium]